MLRAERRFGEIFVQKRMAWDRGPPSPSHGITNNTAAVYIYKRNTFISTNYVMIYCSEHRINGEIVNTTVVRQVNLMSLWHQLYVIFTQTAAQSCISLQWLKVLVLLLDIW